MAAEGGSFEVARLLVGDLDACGVGYGVKFGGDGEPGAGGGRGDGVDDDFVTGQRSSAPVHREVGEQPVLNLG